MADEKPYNISIETKAQISELQKLLAELQSINAEIGKMNGLTLSSINTSVSELVKTGKELSNTFVSLSKPADKVANGLKKIGEKSDESGDKLDGLKTTAQGVFMEIGAQITDFAVNKLKQIPAAIIGSIQAFGQQEAAVQKLAAAIRSQGGNVSEVLPIMSSFASEMQRITTYGDEQVLAMQAMATSMGVNSEQMETTIQSAIGLASALNMDVMTAVKAASAAVQGKTTMLQEYIPALVKCKTEEEKLAKVQELSASGFAQAKAEAETTAGKLKQVSNAWGNLAEVAGGTFAPVAVEVANGLKFICEQLSKNSEITQIFIGGLSSLAVGFAFSKIGGLASVAALFKMVASGMSVAKAASDGLNASLRANPLGIAVTAVSAFGMVVAHLHSKEKERYEQNIEQSREYRDGIDAEINAMKQWGISAENNKKRTAEVAAEIAKLKAEEARYRQSSGQLRGTYGGATYKVYSKEEQAQLDNYRAKIEKLEERQNAAANAKELDALAAKRHAEVVKAANEILAKSAKEMRAAKSATEALNVTREKYASTEKEIAELDKALKSGNVADSQRIATAERLSQAQKELLELGKKEMEQELAIASSKYDARKTAELKKQNELELQLAGARLRGDKDNAKSLENNLADVKLQQKRLDLISSYVSARNGEIKTSDDLKQTQSDAARYANAILESEKERAETEKWLAAEVEGNKTVQRGLEMDILRARASGNEALAKEIEGNLKVSQLASEIFENTRKEGMSRKELESLMETARGQAQERYDLEKSVSDELERQNLAKDAQSKIEDILLANKIEQLKAEGKITEARELEREREIKRTLAGLKGVSAEDKEKLANTMRQTNSYRDEQETSRKESAPGATTKNYGGSKGSSNTIGESSSDMLSSGGTSRQTGRPATVSAKSAALYDEWKAAGGSKSGQSWTDFRKSRSAAVGNKEAQAQAQGILSATESTAKNIANRNIPQVGGVLGGVLGSISESRKQPSLSNNNNNQKLAANPALNNKLESMQVDSSKENSKDSSAQSLGEIAAVVKTMGEDIKSLKASVMALTEERTNNA